MLQYNNDDVNQPDCFQTIGPVFVFFLYSRTAEALRCQIELIGWVIIIIDNTLSPSNTSGTTNDLKLKLGM